MGRVHVEISGAVQGSGFRPFVFRLASELRLGGFVLNSPEGVTLEAEGPDESVSAFLSRLQVEKPSASEIHSLHSTWRPARGEREFSILPSRQDGERGARVPPDRALCAACRRELFDPSNRRYRYPFLNCTDCGPRYSILEALPYDRSRTTMRKFPMCPDCLREYRNPLDRRFHAQPNACPACGPQVELWAKTGEVLGRADAALEAAAHALRAGRIVAVKGLGGFHLMVDAAREDAVAALRERKRRPEKPLAVMFPGWESLRAACLVEPAEAELLHSWRSPIVLLRKRGCFATDASPSANPDTDADADFAHAADATVPLAKNLAPGSASLGAMLPYTPLHALLLRLVARPLVATSGNLSDEPIVTDEKDALARLREVADLFLVHDRPIARALDDSLVQVAEGKAMVLRLARGYAPLALDRHRKLPSLVAAGGHEKGALAITAGSCVVLGHHLGDLDHPRSRAAFQDAKASLLRLYGSLPAWTVGDRHPDYAATALVEAGSAAFPALPALPPVQHHHAHVAAAMAESGLRGPVLGVAWDGTGLGMDGTLWGGEFLRATFSGFERLAHLLPYRLPGGDGSAREPARCGLAVWHALYGMNRGLGGKDADPDGKSIGPWLDLPSLRAFPDKQRRVLVRMLSHGINAPWTTSVGRLFDAAASLSGLRQTCSFEGQAAMEWEDIAEPGETGAYPMVLEKPDGRPWVLDWRPLFQALLAELAAGLPRTRLAARFHNGLAEGIATVAGAAGLRQVVLAGGCFQNRLLLAGASRRLQSKGFEVYWPRSVPINDGGLALGQAVIAAERILEEED